MLTGKQGVTHETGTLNPHAGSAAGLGGWRQRRGGEETGRNERIAGWPGEGGQVRGQAGCRSTTPSPAAGVSWVRSSKKPTPKASPLAGSWAGNGAQAGWGPGDSPAQRGVLAEGGGRCLGLKPHHVHSPCGPALPTPAQAAGEAAGGVTSQPGAHGQAGLRGPAGRQSTVESLQVAGGRSVLGAG